MAMFSEIGQQEDLEVLESALFHYEGYLKGCMALTHEWTDQVRARKSRKTDRFSLDRVEVMLQEVAEEITTYDSSERG